MPQPLSNRPDIKYYEISHNVFLARPRHVEMAFRIVALAAVADQGIAKCLIGLAPEKSVKLAQQFNQQENDAKKTAAYETAAVAFLPPDQHEMLKRILKKHRMAMKLRNPFAHHEYGFTIDAEDALLLVDPRQSLLAQAKRYELGPIPPIGTKENTEYSIKALEVDDQAKSNIQCYDLNELFRIHSILGVAKRCFDVFWMLTTMKPPPHVHAELSVELDRYLSQ